MAGNLTRILNNQIYSKTIVASQKIADGTITGSLFSSNVTVPGDFLITGNLFVLGTSAYTTVASTNTYVNDPLIVLNNGFGGTNTYDEGFIFNRGTLQNRALIWSEFYQEFRLIGTTETGTAYGNVAVANYANLHLGNLTVDYTINSTGNFFTSGFINTSGNVSAAVHTGGQVSVTGLINTAGNVVASQGSFGTINTTGLINTLGNVSASNLNTATLTATGLINTTGNVSAATVNAALINASGNVVATVFNGGAVNVSGNVLASSLLASSVTASAGTFGIVSSPFIGNTGTAFTGASLNVTGNVLVATINSTTENTSTVNAGAVNAVTIGNTGATVQGTTAQFTGNVIGGLASFAAINATPIGNATASTGAFTTLTASSVNSAGNVLATGGVFNALTVNGNETVTGYLNVTGNILASTGTINTLLVNDATNATSSTAGGALTVAGGAAFGKDVYIGGNLYAANIIGVTANVITVQDPLLYLRPNVTIPYNYDIGVYSAFTGVSLATANVYQHTGIVRDWHNSTWTFASNLTEPGGGSVLFDANTIYDPIKAGNLSLVNTTVSTSTGTGALIVSGGAGIAGTVVAGQLNSTGNVLGQGAVFNSLQVNGAVGATGNIIGGLAQFASINSTPIGNATASTGAFTTLSASAGIWGNSTTASTNTTTGALVLAGGLGLAGNIFQGGAYHDTSSSNFILAGTPTTVDAFKAATTLNLGATSGTATIQNPTLVGTQATQALYNTVASTVNFARAANITMGHTDGTTTLQGNANVRAVTNGITYTQGALISAGAVGVAGNLNIKGNSRVTIGTELASSIVYPENQVQAVFDNTGAQRISIVNKNIYSQAEFTAQADNGSNIARFVSTGITNSNFNAGLAIGPGDAYTSVNLGNLFLASTDYDVGILAGGLYANNFVARFSTVNSNVQFFSTRVATSATQAAFTVAGGAGIAGNLYVAKGAVFNSGLSTDTFQIKSSTSGNVALFANLSAGAGTSESVIIGGANTVVQSGVTLKVNSTTTMMVPVGPTSARPSSIFGAGYDAAGMMRFNNTINNLEFYDGSSWQAAGSTFTVISDRQFSGNVAGGYGNVDGTNTAYTLQANATTAGALISINGVLQFPTLAYSISGTTLTFTEPPAPGDVIDARIITTTTTLSTLASGSGLNQFIAAETGLQFWTGTSATTLRANIDQSGNFNYLTGNKFAYDQTATQVANTNLTLLDSFSANAYTSAKYVISMKQGTGNVQAMESLVTTNGLNAWVTTYGIVNTGNNMGTLAANVSGGTCSLWLVPLSGTAISNVKVMTTYIV